VPQAQQGEQVRAEHQERILGQPEDGRDGIEGEYDVGHPERDDQHDHGGDAPAAAQPGGQPRAGAPERG
jgi:hypothetical protein